MQGFGDRHGAKAFRQTNATGTTVEPFRLRAGGVEYCMPDITHDWGPQHQAYDHGRMNDFVRVHEAADGAAVGIETMGYYTRSDLRFYHGLEDAFTICDGYHCSVIGPTDPNRIMSMSATLDPSGAKGGPLLETLVGKRGSLQGTFKWTTMPERLQARGVGWKVYTSPAGGILDNVLPYFAPYNKPGQLADRALNPTFPNDFLSDLKHDSLPAVSWLLTGLPESEHPGFSSAVAGEIAAAQIVQAVMANPKVWRKTALFITWDENGGFFDHVAPPVAPKGTKGEFLTVSPLPTAANGIAGPIGLGFRVPMLVVSPVHAGRVGVPGCVRPHVDAAVPGNPLRRRGPEPQRVAAWGQRGPDQRVQLRRAAAIRTAPVAEARQHWGRVPELEAGDGARAVVPAPGAWKSSPPQRNRQAQTLRGAR